ncbi:MAG: hypothetical protein ACI3YC_07615, partial [Alloprevotella sp.]
IIYSAARLIYTFRMKQPAPETVRFAGAKVIFSARTDRQNARQMKKSVTLSLSAGRFFLAQPSAHLLVRIIKTSKSSIIS